MVGDSVTSLSKQLVKRSNRIALMFIYLGGSIQKALTWSE